MCASVKAGFTVLKKKCAEPSGWSFKSTHLFLNNFLQEECKNSNRSIQKE
jgi:hypothetical protein